MNIKKFARFTAGGKQFQGLVEGGSIRVIEGDMYGAWQPTQVTYPLGNVTVVSPVNPSKIIGVGLNYKAVAQAKGVEFPPQPILFLKPPSGLIGPDEAIVLPPAVKDPAFEVEVAVVIGKKAKNVPEAQALDVVFGYSLTNDVTAKDHMPKGQPWARGKSFDTFTAVGPFIVTGLDPDNIDIRLTVNGAEKQNSNTADMIFGIRKLIADISAIMTLEPGDVILTGTPPGGGAFAAGDSIELSSPQLGTMTNPVR